MQPFETLSTDKTEVICSGVSGPLGHPQVFLHIDRASNSITCPYCSRLFVYTPKDERKAG